MRFSPYVTTLLKQKSGHDLRLSADCEYLALDIESVTGEHIGVNTLKRLLGFIDDEREPRISTLDVIARYLGFKSWEELHIYDDKTVGQQIQISYLPDRRLIIEYQGNNTFFILSSQNSKLQDGDQITITHIVSGYPLLVSQVIRNGQSLGSFTAGKAQGITFKIL